MKRSKPVVLTNAFRRPQATLFASGRKLSSTGEVYATTDEIIKVIANELEAVPLQVPTLADHDGIASVLDVVDGILLPGAVSNMEPHLYGETPNGMPQVFAPDHDALDIFLVRAALQRGIPLLGICRGMQTINVAMGGTMHQSIKAIQGLDHLCSVKGDGASEDVTELHEVSPVSGGKLAGIMGEPMLVNSIHEQAVNRPGTGVVIEATAPDGITEAISVNESPAFMLGVQWHPESQPHNPAARAIFAAFAKAIRE